VAGSIPDEAVGFLNLPNSSSRTMALGSTQPLTEMSTRNLKRGKGRPVLKSDNLTAICEPFIWKMWKPRRLTTLWASTACYRDSFNFITFIQIFHYSVCRILLLFDTILYSCSAAAHLYYKLLLSLVVSLSTRIFY
jgi:hypothetical protein